MAETVQTITAILPGSKCSVQLLQIVVQDAVGEMPQVYPQLNTKVHVDDIKVHVGGKKSVLKEAATEVIEKLKEVFR